MLKTFPIDFIRQVFEQTLFEEHIKDINLFGGKDQVSILSFYEQLKSQEEVDRFIETYRDLAEQQNRTGLILNGVLVAPENPSITNLYSSLIIPMSFTLSFRCKLQNRDQAIVTINNLIEKLKGKKVDIGELKNSQNEYSLFKVGTVGQGEGKPTLKSGDYIGHQFIQTVNVAITRYKNKGLSVNYNDIKYLYCKNQGKIKTIQVSANKGNDLVEVVPNEDELVSNRYIETTVYIDKSYNREDLYPYCSATITLDAETPVQLTKTNGEIISFDTVDYENVEYKEVIIRFDLGANASDICEGFTGEFVVEDQEVFAVSPSFDFIEDDGTHPDIIFPPEHTSFEEYKISFSFDAIRCDEPRNLNGDEYCELSFGGSATLVSNGVQLGNDLLKISVSKYGIKAQTPIVFTNAPIYYLEPLEMPSGNNANTQVNQLLSNKFVANTHTDAIALTLQYTFIADFSINLLEQWFKYARYGTQGITATDISPNMIYIVKEYWCSWGEYEVNTVNTKIIDSIDIENTESDTLTLSLTMQIQGEND